MVVAPLVLLSICTLSSPLLSALSLLLSLSRSLSLSLYLSRPPLLVQLNPR